MRGEPLVCGFVRKDGAESCRFGPHLWPCAEKRESGDSQRALEALTGLGRVQGPRVPGGLAQLLDAGGQATDDVTRHE